LDQWKLDRRYNQSERCQQRSKAWKRKRSRNQRAYHYSYREKEHILEKVESAASPEPRRYHVCTKRKAGCSRKHNPNRDTQTLDTFGPAHLEKDA
jgi:hypothetical protein